jgi:hypothetical protein
MPFATRSLTILALAATSLMLAGCNVSEHKNGKSDDVNINVPFANMHVKTNDNAPVSGIGLSVYPGAQPLQDKDNDSADVNMSFGSFHLGVKAASFQTTDSPVKVEAFYRKDMAKYGDVIKCQNGQPVGQPAKTSQGLNCTENDHHGKVHGVQIHGDTVDVGSDNPELRTGSEQHQHVVSIEPKNGGTKIGLVLLDLPTSHDNDDAQSE